MNSCNPTCGNMFLTALLLRNDESRVLGRLRTSYQATSTEHRHRKDIGIVLRIAFQIPRSGKNGSARSANVKISNFKVLCLYSCVMRKADEGLERDHSRD